VTYFLLVYARVAATLLEEHEFGDRREALGARFAAEKARAGDRAIEVVVLGARSREDLLRTHGRYFFTVAQLVARLEETLHAVADEGPRL
jgi:hypothetical protein